MLNYYRIYGDPVPYTAPKFCYRKPKTIKGWIYYKPTIYSPVKYKGWKNRVAQVVKGSLEYKKPMQGPVCLTLFFYLARPKSSKRKLPDVKPDLDNLCKGVIDAIKNDLLIHDDNQIIELTAGKYYTTNEHAAGVEIKISEWQEESF